MIEKAQWTLKEIREAYGEILRIYNILFPLDSQTKREWEEIGDPKFSSYGDDFSATFHAKYRKILPELKEAADRSGNAVTWLHGEPLDGLDQRMRDRIEKALKFGI